MDDAESAENISTHSSSKEALAISGGSNDSYTVNNLPPISPVHIDFDDLKNDFLEIENQNPSAFDDLLSNFSAIDENDNQSNISPDPIVNQTNSDDNGAASTVSTNSTVYTKRSSASIAGSRGGIKLVPIESLMKSTGANTNEKNTKKKTAKCHIALSSSESVEEISSELASNANSDSDTDDDGDGKKLKSRYSRQKKYQKNLKKRFEQLRQKARKKRPNYAEDSNSDASVDDSDDGEENQKTSRSKENRKGTDAAAGGGVTKNIYSATVQLTKLPANLKTLLYKYDLSEIRDRHQKILASRPRTHRNEVYAQTSIHPNLINRTINFSLFTCLCLCLCLWLMLLFVRFGSIKSITL